MIRVRISRERAQRIPRRDLDLSAQRPRVRHPLRAIRERPGKWRPPLLMRAAFSLLAPLRRRARYAECLDR